MLMLGLHLLMELDLFFRAQICQIMVLSFYTSLVLVPLFVEGILGFEKFSSLLAVIEEISAMCVLVEKPKVIGLWFYLL